MTKVNCDSDTHFTQLQLWSVLQRLMVLPLWTHWMSQGARAHLQRESVLAAAGVGGQRVDALARHQLVRKVRELVHVTLRFRHALPPRETNEGPSIRPRGHRDPVPCFCAKNAD